MDVLNQIRRSHRNARPTHENPSWMHTHNDLSFVLAELDRVYAEHRIMREALQEMADADYRGNRSSESVKAFQTLERMKAAASTEDKCDE
jgi:hypothetical protein